MKSGKIDWTDPKYEDPMEELYAIRRQISTEYNHDIHKLCEALREKEAHAKSMGMSFFEYCFSDEDAPEPLMACEGE